MAELKVLAIDLGASSGRGIVGKFDGKKFTVEENHRFPNEPVNTNGNFNWDILRIFHEIKTSISKCALSIIHNNYVCFKDFLLLRYQTELSKRTVPFDTFL